MDGQLRQTELLDRAQRYLVGGTLGEFRLPSESAMVISHASGTRIFDCDGKEYIDFLLGSGPMMLGHCHPRVVAAVQEQVARGTTFLSITEPAIRLAEQIVEAVPCGEKLRFTSSGSEAMSYAIRFARAFTGRSKYLRFEGAWHGVSDTVLFNSRPTEIGTYPASSVDGAGIPSSYASEVLTSPFNDSEAARQLIKEFSGELAAVVVEPLQRCIRPRSEFLEELRRLTIDHGILLVFDEVVTGFRLAWGGAQERYGVIPDLAAYGKSISGGYPNAAVCGRADVLDTANPWREPTDPKRVIASGTFSGNPVSAAAGLATLDVLKGPGTYERLHAMGATIVHEIEGMGNELSIPLKVGGEGPVLQVLFTEESSIVDYGSMLRADKLRAYRYGLAMIRRGFFISPYEKIYLSTVHSDDDISRFLEATREVLREELASGVQSGV